MDGKNLYYAILSHALNKEKESIEDTIKEYKDALNREAKRNYKTILHRREFPYCLCSLPESLVERAVEIESISLTPRSMHIGLITREENTDTEEKKENSKSEKCEIKRETAILRCSCYPKKKIDWENKVYVKLVCLLTDYRYKMLGTLKVLDAVFLTDTKNMDILEVPKGEMLSDMEIAKCIERSKIKENLKSLLMLSSTKPEKHRLIMKILKETRKKVR